MNSGLYSLPGRSPTAAAAAWANRLDWPTTKLVNVYLSFSGMGAKRAGTGGREGAAGTEARSFSRAEGDRPFLFTTISRVTVSPAASANASASARPYFFSIQVLAVPFGTARISRPAWRDTGKASPSQLSTASRPMCLSTSCRARSQRDRSGADSSTSRASWSFIAARSGLVDGGVITSKLSGATETPAARGWRRLKDVRKAGPYRSVG